MKCVPQPLSPSPAGMVYTSRASGRESRNMVAKDAALDVGGYQVSALSKAKGTAEAGCPGERVFPTLLCWSPNLLHLRM